ncbi:MAG: hypothetical protein R2838_11165 [Caldilineaceae bacterium]
MPSLLHLHPPIVHFRGPACGRQAAGLTVLYITPRADLRALTWWAMLLGWIAAS